MEKNNKTYIVLINREYKGINDYYTSAVTTSEKSALKELEKAYNGFLKEFKIWIDELTNEEKEDNIFFNRVYGSFAINLDNYYLEGAIITSEYNAHVGENVCVVNTIVKQDMEEEIFDIDITANEVDAWKCLFKKGANAMIGFNSCNWEEKYNGIEITDNEKNYQNRFSGWIEKIKVSK